MKSLRYRSIGIVIIGLVLIAQALILAPNAAAQGLQAEGKSDHSPAGVTSNDWDQIIQQIDPYYGQQAYLKAPLPAESGNFGYSVDVSGDTLVIGAYYEDITDPTVPSAGTAYVFVHSGITWEKQAQLVASNPDQYDNFGWSVAIDGDTIVVGAPQEDSNGTGGPEDDTAISAGAAYVFERSGTTWSQKAYLKSTVPAGDDYFGGSVAIDGKTIVVGAYREDLVGPTANAGGAYVFVRGSSFWAFQDDLHADNYDSWDYFGYSVAIDGNQIVVGAWGENSNGSGGPSDNSANDAGAAYFFWRNINTGTWSQKAYLKASNAEMNDSFGRSVAISGETIVIGADGEDSNGTGGQGNNSVSSAGAVYVFEHIGSDWLQQAYLKASNAGYLDVFGRSVTILGDTILVGAPGEASDGSGPGNNDESAAGAVYIFVRRGTEWMQQGYLKADNAEKDDYFGCSVALKEDTVVSGAYGEDSDGTSPGNNGASTAGAAYVFIRNYPTFLPLITR